jgi:hypothetical protein
MDSFPDITAMTIQEPGDFITELEHESDLVRGLDEQPLDDTSLRYGRQIARNQRDLVRAELTRRLRDQLGDQGA